jgi:hypothetical protein
MVVRKGKLKKPCDNCGKLFIPTSRTNKLCKKCGKRGSGWLDRLYKKQKKNGKAK